MSSLVDALTRAAQLVLGVAAGALALSCSEPETSRPSDASELPRPPRVPVAISVAENGCAVFSDGSVECWGHNGYGALGTGDTDLLVLERKVVPGLCDVVQIVAGGVPCARLSDGTVRCWGDNSFGAVGDGTGGNTRPAPTPVLGVDNAVDLGGWKVIMDDGTVVYWGLAWPEEDSWLPRTQEGIGSAVDISHGPCALVDDGRVWCWSENLYGHIDIPTFWSHDEPRPVLGIERAIDFDAAGAAACAVTEAHEAWCWGDRRYFTPFGNNGVYCRHGDCRYFPGPYQLPVNGVLRVSLGRYYSCILHTDGTVSCWLDGGEIRPVEGVTNVVDLTVARWDPAACVLTAQSEVWCWGHNGYGQLGLGYASAELIERPQRIPFDPHKTTECGER